MIFRYVAGPSASAGGKEHLIAAERRKKNFSHQKRTFTPHFTYKKWVIRSCASGFTEYFFAYVTLAQKVPSGTLV